MNAFEAGGFCGLVGGGIVGALVCESHGGLALAGGAVGGAIVGSIAGYLSAYPLIVLWAIAAVFWQVMTGRLKFPKRSSKSQRRNLLVFIGVLFAVSMLVLAGIYFFGSEAQRSGLRWVAVAIFGTCIVGALVLKFEGTRE